MKKERAIVCLLNRDYIFAFGAFCENLIHSNTKFDHLIVYICDVSKEEKEWLAKEYQFIQFIDYTLDDFINEFSIDEFSEKAQLFINRYTHLTYLKCKIFQLLESYKHVIFMDIDMLIAGNIDELFKLECGVAWRDGENLIGKLRPYFAATKESVSTSEDFKDITSDIKAPNGGLLVANDCFDYEAAWLTCKNFLKKYINFYHSAIDELTIAYSVYKNNINRLSLDENIYNTVPDKYNIKTKIVHFMGYGVKPWESTLVQSIWPDWMKFYKKFEKKSGWGDSKVKCCHNIGADSFTLRYYNTFWIDFLYKTKLDKKYNVKVDFNSMSTNTLSLYKNNFIEYRIANYMYFNNVFSISVVFLTGEICIDQIEEILMLFDDSKWKIIKTNDVVINSSRVSYENALKLFKYAYSNTALKINSEENYDKIVKGINHEIKMLNRKMDDINKHIHPFRRLLRHLKSFWGITR